MSHKEPSRLFRHWFMGCGGGSPVLRCGCGRTHFSDSPHYDDGERRQLLLKAQTDKRYVHHEGCDAVVDYVIMGRSYVDGCECNYAHNVEPLLWTNRGAVSKYLRARVDERINEDAELLSVLGKGADD